MSYPVACTLSWEAVAVKRFTLPITGFITGNCSIGLLVMSALIPKLRPPYPSPCDHCGLCPWRERCDQKRIADDHLSVVANITRQQVVRLERAGVRTVAQLAFLASDANVSKLVAETLIKLREQAALQVHERETGEQKAVLLPIQQEEVRGFLRLPRPDAGDVFFDMEGNPMEEGGLEYLFGIYYFDDGKPVFKPFWGHDRAQERQAFMDFMDFTMTRLEQFPGMHIYHYAHYENTALKRLMSLHGVREYAVDRLLREHKLVDLYKVVREGLRISKPSYSIKAVEAFYTEKRSGEVKKATDSIVVYERWRETGDAALLESIRQYNQDDCRSTWQLREWLLSLRPDGLPWFSDRSEPSAAASTRKPAREKSDKTVQLEEQLARLQTRLLAETECSGLKRDELELVAALLDFYRRSDKPAWWALFERQEASIDELMEEPEVIAGLYGAELWATGDRFDIYRFHYPEQDFKVREGDYAVRLNNLKDARVRQIDEDACTVDLEMYLRAGEQIPEPLSISIGKPVTSETMRCALFAFANSVLEGDDQYKAIRDFLAHRLPDIRGTVPGTAIVDPEREALPQIIAATHGMASSCLFIQGPPGTGKTYTGSHLIASLLQAGKRVAVSSNSHKAINNLLQAVDKRMKDAGATYRGMKKVSSAEQEIDSDFIENVGDEMPILKASPPAQLVAGTVWLLSKPAFWQSFDYLFIDEAGQLSLANTIALGMCAKNLILLGDQMQLGQPIQGVHPGRSGESSLEYLLNGEATIAPERGVFLGTTFRMHPDVCRFISDAIYDSRLHSDPSTYDQRLVLNEHALPELIETGIKYVPVIHDGCSQRSEEEAAVVKGLFENLLTQRYRTGDGEERSIGINDILVVAPYNMQVNLLKKRLPGGGAGRNSG